MADNNTLQNNSDKAIDTKAKIPCKRIFIGVVILAVLFYAYWTEWRFEHVRLSMAAKEHLNDYRNYFYKVEQLRVRPMPSPFGGGDL